MKFHSFYKITDEEFEKLHWKEKWEHCAIQAKKELEKKSEKTLLKKLEKENDDPYFQIWYLLGEKGTVKNTAPVLWKFLKENPGETKMLSRYHCAAALFKILGLSEPDEKNKLREQVQWDHDGEKARQKALTKLKKIIQSN